MRVTEKGVAAIEGKSYVEYDDHEVFIPKGEVYTAHRTIMNIMSQARTELFAIDPYVDEELLDMFAVLDSSVEIRVLTEHLKGNFKLAFRKLQHSAGELRCAVPHSFMTDSSSSTPGLAINWVALSTTPAQRQP